MRVARLIPGHRLVALGIGAIALAAIGGASWVRGAVVAAAMFTFVAAYQVTSPPGRASYAAAVLRPIGVMRASALVVVAATGGWASPLLSVVVVPSVIAWSLVGLRREDIVHAALAVAVLFCAPSVSFSGWQSAVLAVGSTALVTWAIGRGVARLLAVQRGQAAVLARLREGALADAESRRRGMERLTTQLAHELKNPLAAIKSLVQVEAKHATEDKSQRRLAVALAEIERMGGLLCAYLDVTRPVVEAAFASVALDELIGDVAALVAGRAEAAGVALAVEGGGGVVRADGRLLKEALVNVVCNAIEATPRGGEVRVRYDLAACGARIEICDTGCGMAATTAARVGTPFFTTGDHAVGLGAACAKATIAQHGGTLSYQSTPGVGTIARIVLPSVIPRGTA